MGRFSVGDPIALAFTDQLRDQLDPKLYTALREQLHAPVLSGLDMLNAVLELQLHVDE